ncbi:MAG: hypothetical protein C0507_00070 [Cyanobacteria bacterium PR.3.49]|nr:hypothetical protein [Cyanobacteria bacterium PR.3.49]
MSAKRKDGRNPDSGSTAHGEAAPSDDDETVETNTSANSDPELIRGKVLEGKYEILSHLGSGAMGAVYKARHAVLNKEVAVKVLIAAALDDPVKKKRFMREAKAQGGLTHRNIAAVHDVGLTEKEQPFFVMDLLVGESLEEHLEKNKSLEFHEFVAIFEQVARALHHAHTKGIIHRDIKPSNIMLLDTKDTEDGEIHALVVDFGIAVHSQEELTKLTKIGYIVGTPHYMSPEQIEAKTLDARSDIYSLGCVMYEALSGNVPFLGMNAAATMALHLAQKPEHITSFTTKSPLPAALAELIMRCIEKDPAMRFSSAKEIAVQLSNLKLADLSAGKEKEQKEKTQETNFVAVAGKEHTSKNPAHAPAPVGDNIELVAGQDLKEVERESTETSSTFSEKVEDSVPDSTPNRMLDKSSSSESQTSAEKQAATNILPTPQVNAPADKMLDRSEVITIVTVIVCGIILWPANGRLSVPPEMRASDSELLNGVIAIWNHFTLHVGWQWIVWVAILFLIGKGVKGLLRSQN